MAEAFGQCRQDISRRLLNARDRTGGLGRREVRKIECRQRKRSSDSVRVLKEPRSRIEEEEGRKEAGFSSNRTEMVRGTSRL